MSEVDVTWVYVAKKGKIRNNGNKTLRNERDRTEPTIQKLFTFTFTSHHPQNKK